MKKMKITSLMIIALLFLSSVSYADSFNFANIKYDSIYNLAGSRGYTINRYNVSTNNNNSRYGVVISGLKDYVKNGVIIPVRPSKPSTPSVPSVPKEPTVPTTPTVPTQPTQPTQPSKPTTPTEPTKPSQPSQPSTPVAGLSAQEMEVVRLVNIEREKAGLKPLKASSELSKVARAKSEDMGRNNYFSHTSPTYGSPFDMMRQFGISYRTAGENIAKGYLSAESVVRGWMNSPGHRANILNPNFGTIGVGAYKTSNNTIYWTQMFTN